MSAAPEFVGRYRVIRLLGQGGMGAVYLAQDPAINRQVAIKFLGDRLDDEEMRERFAREPRAAGGLRHPNIVTIFDVGEQDGRPYIVMEYVAGETLLDVIRRRAPLALARKLQLIEGVCMGLGHAHAAGIIHRDIKPANIVVDENGTVKILDFGIAKLGETRLTKSGAIPGTLNYLAPELITTGQVDHRSDIFAVGAVLYELLAGRQAFPGSIHDGVLGRLTADTPPALPDLGADNDDELRQVVARALAKRPEDRFATLDEMRDRLAQIRARVEQGARPTTARPAEASPPPPISIQVAAGELELGRAPSTTARRPLAFATDTRQDEPAPAPSPTRDLLVDAAPPSTSRSWAAIAAIVALIAIGSIIGWRWLREPEPVNGTNRLAAGDAPARATTTPSVATPPRSTERESATPSATATSPGPSSPPSSLAQKRPAATRTEPAVRPTPAAQKPIPQPIEARPEPERPPPPPPSPTQPVRVGGNIKVPTKLKDVPPVYPPIAQSARVQGVVIIEATIGGNGKVTNARVLRSIPLLDEAAIEAVRQWEFAPTLLNGVPIPVIMTVTVQFTLQ